MKSVKGKEIATSEEEESSDQTTPSSLKGISKTSEFSHYDQTCYSF